MKALLCVAFMFLIADAQMLTRTKVLMGTFATISLEPVNKSYFAPAFSKLQEVEDALSTYKNTTPIYKLNENKNTTLTPLAYEALLLSKKYYEESEGYFNIAIGSVTKDLYKFGSDERVPSKEELLSSSTQFEKIIITPEKAIIPNNIKVDLGGMGKGFGVDKAISFLKSKGVHRAQLGLSGDIRCLGICTIEIQDPFGSGVFAEFQTQKEEMGISTSGNYNRYVQNKSNNHLINPKTKASQGNFASITLVSQLSNSDLDAYATAASVMPKEKAYAFLNALELAYIVVETDGKIVQSQNVEFYIRLHFLHQGVKE
ncbi:MAG: FAD:protein FMN transferase [Campylobacterales bacterium]|nr:FAD:protein FMN transferase [Campylobacterales bacterium]